MKACKIILITRNRENQLAKVAKNTFNQNLGFSILISAEVISISSPVCIALFFQRRIKGSENKPLKKPEANLGQIKMDKNKKRNAANTIAKPIQNIKATKNATTS